MIATGKRYYGSPELPTGISPLLQMRMAPLGGDRGYSGENVGLAISYTQELRQLVTARAMGFYVVIIPTLAEVHAHEYSWPTAQYLKGIENENMQIVPLIQSLAEKDYFAHDGHFTPGGAKVAAAAINNTLKARMIPGNPAVQNGAPRL